MPIFEYKCLECNNVSEFLVGVGSTTEKLNCKNCGGEKLEKVFSRVSYAVKGTSSLPCGTDAPRCEAGMPCCHPNCGHNH